MNNSIILMSDGYKYSQFDQYPPGAEYVYSYIESRGGEWDKTVFFGLQGFIKEYLSEPISHTDIDVAQMTLKDYGLPFYREGWQYILKEHKGYLPVMIRSVDEGTVVPTKNVLVDIINTDPKCWWLTSFLETALLRAIWYPTTVATNSYESKKIIYDALVRTGTPSDIEYKLHDFGARGVSSAESARIGAAAHLVNFKGSDTVEAIQYLKLLYGAKNPTVSIPAMEHSTVTSWGRDREVDSYRNMIRKHAKPGGLVACVSDSYDIFNACNLWGTELKRDVLDSGATLVVRPDSGNPAQVVLKCLQILESHYGSVVNEKGYKVLNNVRVIQGDGIDHRSIQEILDTIITYDYSADNVAFGQGGGLLQHVNRDTLKFAMKCSAAQINGEWVDVYKDPVTDPGKQSKKGLLSLVEDGSNYITLRREQLEANQRDVLNTRFLNGKILNLTTFDDIRKRASLGFNG